MVVDNVGVMIWMDSAPVRIMTTIQEHLAEHWKQKKYSGRNSTNAVGAKKMYKDRGWQSYLPIPECLQLYNQHQVGVDQADQLRTYYGIQQVTFSTWFLLLY